MSESLVDVVMELIQSQRITMKNMRSTNRRDILDKPIFEAKHVSQSDSAVDLLSVTTRSASEEAAIICDLLTSGVAPLSANARLVSK